jgi:hypothetical protein
MLSKESKTKSLKTINKKQDSLGTTAENQIKKPISIPQRSTNTQHVNLSKPTLMNQVNLLCLLKNPTLFQDQMNYELFPRLKKAEYSFNAKLKKDEIIMMMLLRPGVAEFIGKVELMKQKRWNRANLLYQ